MTEQLLTGIRILDLSHYISGAFCTKLLADYGADVIKVERPEGGDGAREFGPFPDDIPDKEKSGLFLHLNTNKKGITLDLKTRTGVDIFKRLLRESDILVENFSPRVMPSLGLDYDTLKTDNPSLIMTSISNFGQTGPYRDWRATELTFNALGGIMNKKGESSREPLKMALNSHQYFAGEVASMVTMAAILRRSKTGIGEHIDISIFETVAGNINNGIIAYDYSGEMGRRTTAKNYPAYPFGGFPVKNGYVSIQGGGRADVWMPRLFEMIGKPELKNDAKFSSLENMAKNRDEFNTWLYTWLAEHTKQEVFDESARVRYPMAPVYNTEELVNNPHYRERGFFIEIEHSSAKKLTCTGAPFKTSHTGFAVRRPAPLLGEHNSEIYHYFLGYSNHDVVILKRSGVI